MLGVIKLSSSSPMIQRLCMHCMDRHIHFLPRRKDKYVYHQDDKQKEGNKKIQVQQQSYDILYFPSRELHTVMLCFSSLLYTMITHCTQRILFFS